MTGLWRYPVALLGYGVTGQALVKIFTQMGLPFRVYDEKKLGSDSISVTTDFSPVAGQLVVFSPSFLHHPWVDQALLAGARVLGELDFLTLYCPISKPILAVTGTNGKTTTVHLLGHLLARQGVRSILCGNIGKPLAACYADGSVEDCDLIVCEVSSFQAWRLKFFSPDYLIWTNFFPSHLNFHRSERDYFEAKLRLLNQTKKCAIVDRSVGEFSQNYNITISKNYIESNKITTKPLSGWCDSPHSSHFLRKNLGKVMSMLEFLQLAPKNVEKMLADFCPPPYRFSQPKRVKNLWIWNDSKATNAAAVKTALEELIPFGGLLCWVTCGQSKGEDLAQFAPIVGASWRVLAFGEMGRKISECFKNEFVIFCENLNQIKKEIRKLLSVNERIHVLFSPGFSSFDQFQSYRERGQWFENLVKEIETFA